MFAVEQEPIRLVPIFREVEEAGSVYLEFRGGHRVVLPPRFHFLWEQTKIGASVYDLCVRLRARAFGFKVFIEVANFLCFLVDHDLIDEIRLVRLADSIRGEYEWPVGLQASLAWSKSLSAWARRKRDSLSQSQAYDFVTALMATLSIPFVVLLVLQELDPRSAITQTPNKKLFYASLVGIWLSGIVGRSGVSALRALSSRMAGDAGELGLKFDFMGPYIAFQPITVTGSFRRACDFLCCFSLPLFMVIQYIVTAPAVSMAFRYEFGTIPLLMSLGVAAVYAHPASQSILTSSLRLWNRTPLVWREEDELREVEAFHKIGSFVSVSMAILFAGVSGYAMYAAPATMFNRLAFSGVLVVGAFVYIEPFFGHLLPGASRRNRRRRLWATKPKILAIAALDREAWSELPVLRQLTAPLRKQLISHAEVVEVEEGQAVCRQGGADRSLYVVLEGRLAVAKSFEGRRRKVVALLTGGAVFGETAFFFGKPRTADVIATERSRLLEIPYQAAMNDLDLASSEEFQFRVWLLQSLAGSPLLGELPAEAMDTLLFAGKRKTFRAGEAIFTEGAPATSCYFIAQGRASAVQGGRKINQMSAGDAFGEIALLKPGSVRTASVVADSDLLCMELEIDAFWALLASRLPLGVEIERLAIRRLRADAARAENSQ